MAAPLTKAIDLADVSLSKEAGTEISSAPAPDAARSSSAKIAVVLLAAVGVLLLAGGGVAAVIFTGGKSSPKAQQPLPAATQESPYARFEYAASTGCLDAALYSTAAGSAAACERKCGLLRRCAGFVFNQAKGTCRLLKGACREVVPGAATLTGAGLALQNRRYSDPTTAELLVLRDGVAIGRDQTNPGPAATLFIACFSARNSFNTYRNTCTHKYLISIHICL